MKEIVHFTNSDSVISDSMTPIIDKLIAENPEINYSKIDVNLDPKIYSFYSKDQGWNSFPVFLGLVDGKIHDYHLGPASSLKLKSLVN